MWFVGSIKSAPCYNEVHCSQHSFPSISLYSCKSCLTLGNCSSVSNLEIDNSFTCHLHVHPQVESGMHAFIPQPQSINALLPVYFTDSVVVLRHARHKKVILETHTFTNQKKCTTTQNKHKQLLSSSGDGRPFGHNRHGPQIGGCAPYGGEAGFPCNTMWPTFVPSGILIHPAVWSQ